MDTTKLNMVYKNMLVMIFTVEVIESNSVQFSSVQDGICALRKAHMCSTLSGVFPMLPLKQFQCLSD